MFRPAVTIGRSLLRHSSHPTILLRPSASTRGLFTAAPKKSSFKGAVARWTLTGAIVYWYATSNVFADEPKFCEEKPPGPSSEDTDRPTSLLPEKPRRSRAQKHFEDNTPVTPSTEPNISQGEDTRYGSGTGESKELASHPRGPEELEEEASQEGAFNPETGEINWDCPCLGGMAHGPCGEEFKTAFSCFVFSTEEPKGVDCIEKFKGMQTCFQKHPEVYGSELDGDDDDDDDEPSIAAPDGLSAPSAATVSDDSPQNRRPPASATDENEKNEKNSPVPNQASGTDAEGGSKKSL